MSYKIAVSSSDGIRIDQSFGATVEFYIYEVEGILYRFLEKRQEDIENNKCKKHSHQCGQGGASGCKTAGFCNEGSGQSLKVSLISDCRCIVCKKIGFQVHKHLERMAISSFDVECSIEEALSKITYYYNKVDNHKSLRIEN